MTIITKRREFNLKRFIKAPSEHQSVMEQLGIIKHDIEKAGAILADTIRQGGKVLLCGNGGNAVERQHIAAEFAVRYENKNPRRKDLAAIALTTDTSILTASVNDQEYNRVFSPQVEAPSDPGDCLIALSTSGNSANGRLAVEIAKKKGITLIGMTGSADSKLNGLANIPAQAPSPVTARISEARIVIGHWWCGLAKESFCEKA